MLEYRRTLTPPRQSPHDDIHPIAPFIVWSEVLASDHGLALTSFAIAGSTISAPRAMLNASEELAVFDSLNLVITKPAAAVIQFGANGEGTHPDEGLPRARRVGSVDGGPVGTRGHHPSFPQSLNSSDG